MPLNLGIDFGSQGCRAAWCEGERVQTLEPEVRGTETGGWLRCEPSQTSGLDKTFPSVKSRLGQGHAGGGALETGASPQEFIVEALRALRNAVEARASTSVRQAVIAVPARYSASRRTALREAAQRAGFAAVHLLNDSMAAVIAHAQPADKPGTVLVYSMGYGGFEIGLVRVARSHYRALGYEGADAPGGATLDELFLRTWLAGLAGKNLVLDTAIWPVSQWLTLRRLAEQTRAGLSATAEAIFPMGIQAPGGGKTWHVSFTRTGLTEAMGKLIPSTLHFADKLLAEAGIKIAEVDEALLVGGATLIPGVDALLGQWLGKPPRRVGLDALARGAALHAARLGTTATPDPVIGDKEHGAAELVELAPSESTLRVNLVVSDGVPVPGAGPAQGGASEERLTLRAVAHGGTAISPAPETLLQFPKQLLEQQQHGRAAAFLEELIRQAQQLLQSARAHPASPPFVPRRARRALEHARQLLKSGQLDEAVMHSHLAWQSAPDHPEVFDQMIEVHRQAAITAKDIDSFEHARRWLLCAHSHDESNLPVRQALAERHYAHARQLADRGRHADARAAVQQSLNWNPDHAGANALQQSLTRK